MKEIKEKNIIVQNSKNIDNNSIENDVGACLVSAHNKTINKPTANVVGVGTLGDPHTKNNSRKFIANVVGADDPVRHLFEDQTQNKKSSKTYLNLISDNRGITLIALIITIIVMLILVATTVTIALNGGLIGRAQDAKRQTEAAMRNEQSIGAGRIKIDGTWYNSIDDYVNDIQSDDQNDEPPKWGQDEDGNITYEGEISQLKIGDYVDYETYVTASSVGTVEINELYEELAKYSGYTGTSYTNKPITKEDLKWRVLDIKDGQIRLISEKPTKSNVYLNGCHGYNNAVYLIDKVCKTLYTTEKGTAQNLKIEDIPDTSITYGSVKEHESSYNDGYYPEILTKMKGCWIDNGKEGTLELSEQDTPIEQTVARKANNSIKISTIIINTKMNSDEWKDTKNIYHELFLDDAEYFLSSRYYSEQDPYLWFTVLKAKVLRDSSMSPIFSAMTDTLTHDGLIQNGPVRPVVTLNSEIELDFLGNNKWQIK